MTVTPPREEPSRSGIPPKHVPGRAPPEKQHKVRTAPYLAPSAPGPRRCSSPVRTALLSRPDKAADAHRQQGICISPPTEAFLCVSATVSGTLLGWFPPLSILEILKRRNSQAKAPAQGALSSSPPITPAKTGGPRVSGEGGWVGATHSHFLQGFPQTV